MKKNDGFDIVFGTPRDFPDRYQVNLRCLQIAKAANFPTDYQDMDEHLYGNENAQLLMLNNDHDKIYGFATFDNDVKNNNTYIHGIIIHPDAQEMGFSIAFLRNIINKNGNLFLSARTQNPRIYEMMSKVAYNGIIFPKIDSDVVPDEIKNIMLTHPAMKDADEHMIVRGAYPDQKITQKVENSKIERIFSKLGPQDAQVIVVCTKSKFGIE